MKPVNYFELDEYARSVAYDFGTAQKYDDTPTIHTTSVEYLCDGSMQYIELAFASLRQWNVQTRGGRKTRTGRQAHGMTYARFSDGVLINDTDMYNLSFQIMKTPAEVQQQMLDDYEVRSTESGIHVSKAGPLRLQRLHGLLDAMSIELSNRYDSSMLKGL
jgi:hypothetical protein